MITLVYELPSASMESGLRTAFELYVSSGILPKVVADNNVSVSFDVKGVSDLINDRIDVYEYISHHKI